MKISRHIETLEHEGAALLAAAERAGPDAEVPTCPGWRVRDLLLHTGNVHRWAAGYVTGGRTDPAPIGTETAPDEKLAAWFRTGHGRLTEGLRAAEDALECWSFLPGSASPRAFWARRQAHETAVHRADAELAAGAELSPVAPEFAADGVDELLTGFHARRRSRVRSDREQVLAVQAPDVPGAAWTVRIGAEPPRTTRGLPEEYDCRVSGPAATVYLALWNRLPYGDGLVIDGDASVATLWQTHSAIV
ncbi:maleylpyruvate isomerase family mycothiol-dependent enzyme [Streptomyces sp. JJ36]|uniref:maleylpyruvate isomerase family mycothiol-dependent enzyme n=1 Tax=Streptomyces sp. JJ36 TaxID=2736645 RepID=UPI001F20F8C6|nr:maleylpyruvate isomerase family mycothiol-dependent enzyme [Streptomyces sp. JJ36]MCF6524379.1 maleylpyruvate isomerase family mycothiol-dependent enzyme [Streptomyces sp. JJ36]